MFLLDLYIYGIKGVDKDLDFENLLILVICMSIERKIEEVILVYLFMSMAS